NCDLLRNDSIELTRLFTFKFCDLLYEPRMDFGELGRRHGGSEPDHSRFDQVLYALTPLFTKSHEVADAGLDKKRRGSGAEEWQNHKEKPHGTDTKKLLTVGEGGHQRCCHACRDGDG